MLERTFDGLMQSRACVATMRPGCAGEVVEAGPDIQRVAECGTGYPEPPIHLGNLVSISFAF